MSAAQVLDECFWRRRYLVGCLVLSFALIAACRRSEPEPGPATQIVVSVDADEHVVALGTEVVIEAASYSASGVPDGMRLSNGFPVAGPAALSWPISLTMVPRNNDFSRVLHIEVTLIADMESIAVLRAQVSFVEQESIEVPLRFSAACLYEASLSCTELQTCDTGSCVETGFVGDPISGATGTQEPASAMRAARKEPARSGASTPSPRAGAAGSSKGSVAGNGAAMGRAGAGGDSSGRVAGSGGSDAPTSTPEPPANSSDPAEDQPSCGNGIVESGETCDPIDSCVTAADCNAADSCLRSSLSGAAATCTASCETYEIEQCVSGDGCCPSDCSVNNDSDCSSSCGDGVVDAAAGERCEPGSSTQPCPTDCTDGDVCTRDYLTGSAANCNAACTSVAIVWPVSGDGCCPPNANATLDLDCEPICGNRIVEPGERCDGRCPSIADCDDGNPCTRDGLAGTGCDRHCTHLALENLGNDGCCPVGANANNDVDCAPVCGNRVVERGETCDGNCRVCMDNDTDPCTVVTTTGPDCSPTCTRETITRAVDNDRCCPAGATQSTDNDCQAAAPVCGNRRKEAGEECDGADCPSCDDRDVCTQDRAVPTPDPCHPVCENKPKAPNAMMQDGCCPAGADSSTDKDCAPPEPVCGNKIKEAGETCDPCPTECDDNKACTYDALIGSGCNAACSHDPIGPGPSDGCCPSGSTMESDPDCTSN